jgi:hypothetical protein
MHERDLRGGAAEGHEANAAKNAKKISVGHDLAASGVPISRMSCVEDISVKPGMDAPL